MPSPPQLLKFQHFAEELTRKTGQFLLKNQNRVIVVKHKKLEDVLTNIDVQAQELIVSEINHQHPDHGIIAEENELRYIRDYTWVVDPLDGTKYYAKGLSIFGTSIGLFFDGKPVVGASFYPTEKTLYSGSVGNGSFFNGKKLTISRVDRLDRSMVYATLPNIGMPKSTFQKTLSGVTNLFNSCYRVRYLGDANIAMSWIAHGAFEAFVNFPGDEPIWDVGAGFAILTSAGGKITDLKGQPIKNFDLTKGIIATNGRIHDQLLKLINS